MARPRKQTIDYFPHACDHGKTMFILEQKHGNNGYALWFKLLEILGKTEGHFLDLNNGASWEFLQAKTKLPGEVCLEILDLLAKLDAIDRELWAAKIVWSQNFMDGVADVYKNRRIEIPTRPSFYTSKPVAGSVSTDENPQSKVKESKEKEKKVKESKIPCSPPTGVDVYVDASPSTSPPTKEEKKKDKNTAPLRFAAACPRPDDVSQQVWSDFEALRKDKKAKLTATALDGIRREAGKASLTLEAALSMCCMRGWQGFQASWALARDGPSRRSPATEDFANKDYGQGGDI